MSLALRAFSLLIPLFFIFTQFYQVHSLNILGVFPYQGKSHFFVFQPYLEELALRGHNVTVISCFPREKSMKNYHDISLADKVKILEDAFPLKRSYYTIFQISVFLLSTGTSNCKTMLADENVRNLVNSKAQFDLVLIEQFNTDCGLGLAHKLSAPVVGLSSHQLMPWYYNRFGVPYNPSFVPFLLLEGGTKPTLYQRVERILFDAYFNTAYKFFGQRVDQNTLAQYFDDIPPLEELGRNMKFLLIYTNSLLTGSKLLPSNVIEVGGFHVAEPKPLPDELKKFIEESEHGVIYISFGSMLKATLTPKDKIEAITAALSELPQRVIWKWEEKTLPGNPKNIYLSKWLPQNDILAHPKVLAFYSHCGLLGTTEAIYHGVPMVGMPIFGDQPSNAAAVEESGLGVQIQFNELSKSKLLEKFRTVLDPKFHGRVKMLSKAWHDCPISAMDSAVYWAEFAAQHHNFTFRTPAADVPLYQYLCLDILSVLFVLILVIIIILKNLLSWMFRSKSSSQKTKKSKRE
ncbi:UDP-glycosyltransferase UGT5-like [Nymphalis io]|uniref:UDP-glycosyltransferase UGT5-like n=1 Tax=Inachis io TaxID=171585 RepID=UPI0021682C77|nr:UDP-glycosyltransferase UGT5-like [Nymphalis io]